MKVCNCKVCEFMDKMEEYSLGELRQIRDLTVSRIAWVEASGIENQNRLRALD